MKKVIKERFNYDIIRNKLHPTDKTIQQIQSYLNSLQKYEKLSLRKAI